MRKGIRQSDGSLLTPYQQAKRYSAELPYSDRPRWIVISNFKKFNIYDMEKPDHEPEILLLENLEDEFYRMNFLIDEGNINIKKALEVSLQAGELVGVLYDALLKEYDNPDDLDTLHYLNVLCVRIVFCLYAEDAGLFGKRNMFHDYLAQYKGAGFRNALMRLFKILNQKLEDRDPYLEDDLAAFPYVNGGLFDDDKIVVPRMNDEIIDIIINQASANFDWSNISPTIFGGVFESTLNPETRREGGMHYTSIENIHKVIDPLFMNELNDEYEKISSLKTVRIKNNQLKKFRDKLASLKFLDPACGSGNFLTETYISLRRLENKVIRQIIDLSEIKGQIILGDSDNGDINPIKVTISQFYGIEINDFAATVAKTALWIAESQMMKETEDIINAYLEYFPIDSDARIVEGNALRMDWEDVVPKRELDYIMGNPPFIGARYMDKNQALDFVSVVGKFSGVGKLDYVVGWYKKASELMINSEIECAYVSTNSITQGEQVAPFWESIFEGTDLKIKFAYQTFIWLSEARDKAAVHCVIIGFSKKERNKKYLYLSDSQCKIVGNINPYLLDAPNLVIKGTAEPICNVLESETGTRVGAQEYIFTEKEMETFVEKEPLSRKYFHEYLGAKEYINNKKRYCLYLEDCPIDELNKMPRSKEIVSIVSNERRAKNHKLKDFPRKYVKLNIPKKDYLFIPQMSSGRRKYIPMGMVSKDIWTADPHFMIQGADLYMFGILSSNVHNAWMRVVAGRLKSDYRYSNRIVYNTFIWPELLIEQKKKIGTTAKSILDAREIHGNVSLSKLYDTVMMPTNLIIAHQENDKAVMEAYGFNWRTMTESECVADLMKMYQKLTQD